jgi:hemoglobin
MSLDKPSLYDRVGGVYSIATVVDDFIDRIRVDPRLNANPLVNEAHHRYRRQASNILSLRWCTGRVAARKGTRVSPWRTLMQI